MFDTMQAERQNNPSSQSNFALLLGLFKKQYLLILIPVALFSAGAAAYILTAKPSWRATQSLQIRDELALKTVMPGRFDSLDMMKMVQETIHDTARRQAVVSKVLNQLEPPEDYKKPEQWPTIKDIESLQDSISLTPPNGAEFGKTEVLLLSVKSQSVERAKKIVSLLAFELQRELNELRDKRAVSIENELNASVKLAQQELESANTELSEFEKELGPIIVDLRSISSDQGGGSSGLQSQLNILVAETRAAQQKLGVLNKQLANVQKASDDPNHVLSFSSELLTAQPSLQKLKEQLITIQSSTAKTLGQFADHHPKAKAAMEAEKVVVRKIREEVQVAKKGLEGQVSVAQDLVANLGRAKEKLDKQFLRLAEVRAPYASLLKKVDQRRAVANKALEDLARAKSQRTAANTTNLITMIDEPYSGSKPEGMSKKIIIGAAGFAGLVSGIGLVFFAASPSFIGPMSEENRNSSSVTLATESAQDWRQESLALAPGESNRRASRQHKLPQEDLHVEKVDFSDDLDVDNLLADSAEEAARLDEPQSAPAETTQQSLEQEVTPSRRVEPFKLEPRKSKKRPVDDLQAEDNTDSSISETVDAAIDSVELSQSSKEIEAKLQEEHRRRIEKMFEEDS